MLDRVLQKSNLPATIAELFKETCSRDNEIFLLGDVAISYSQFNEFINHTSARLGELGISPDHRVAHVYCRTRTCRARYLGTGFLCNCGAFRT